jgi:hypothetical protein
VTASVRGTGTASTNTQQSRRGAVNTRRRDTRKDKLPVHTKSTTPVVTPTTSTAPQEQLRRGQLYTRAEAGRLLGCGPYQGFFAYKNGEAIAIFPLARNNPYAREGVLCIHDAADRPRSGPLLKKWLRERSPVHVFWDAGDAQWEYAGRWRPLREWQNGPLGQLILDAARRLSPEWPPVMAVVLQPD